MMNPHRYIFFILFFIGIHIFTAPVFAGEVPIYTVVHVYFEKEGMPYNDNVSFKVTCYGNVCDGRDCRDATKARIAETGKTELSGNCTEYGCPNYIITYDPPPTFQYIRCDMTGTSPEGNFSIRNYSDTPFMSCIQINPGTMVLWKFRSDEAWPADWQCDMQLALPSGTRTPVIAPASDPGSVSAQHTSTLPLAIKEDRTPIPKSPFGSLYCSILSLFGVRCS